jgi:hypothetical protein
VHYGGDELRKLKLEPLEFCRKWVKSPQPGERGYYKVCVRFLAKATGLSERTVEGWGAEFSNHPDYVLITLKKEDTILQIRELVKQNDLSDFIDEKQTRN